jgi:hypothetical protein
VATWRSSQAAGSLRAGHQPLGIAGLSKQRYRVRIRRDNVLLSNLSFKADGFAAA